MKKKQKFLLGTPKEIFEKIYNKLPEINSDYIWHYRGISLLSSVIEVLCFLRDKNQVDFDIKKVKETMELKNVMCLLKSNIPEKLKENFKYYMNNLHPSDKSNQYEAHKFITSKVNEALLSFLN